MAYKTRLCTCPADSKLVFLGHLRDCPEAFIDQLTAEVLEVVLGSPLEELPTPPQELSLYLCFGCHLIHQKLSEVGQCQGAWARPDVHFKRVTYQLVE